MISIEQLSSDVIHLIDQCRERRPAVMLPNILITGTPGCGKTELCERVSELSTLRHIDVGSVVRSDPDHYSDGYDDIYGCHEIDEDGICDYIEQYIDTTGGVLIDTHTVDYLAERYFDLIIVLHCNNTVLYDRLTQRGYTGKKLSDNIECEIMNVIGDSVRECYDEQIIVELQNETIDDLDSNTERTMQWLHTVLKKRLTDGA